MFDHSGLRVLGPYYSFFRRLTQIQRARHIHFKKQSEDDFFLKNEMEMMHVDDVLWVAYI
jgi:hypothetical protein